MPPTNPANRRPISPAVVAVGAFVLALNLRIGISSVGPVLPLVVHDLGTGLVFGSFLTTLPVVMMGLMSPWSARAASRWGLEWTVVGALVVVAAAVAARALTLSPWALLLTAVALGAGIAAGNTVLPALVGVHFPTRGALMTGLYTVGINAGAGSAAFATPRIASTVASTWRGALAVWAVPALLAATLWVCIATRVRHPARPDTLPAPGPVPRAAIVALLFGLQSMAYYGVLAWLAPLYEEHGWSPARAGVLVSVFTGTQVVGSILASVVVQRTGRLARGIRVTALTFGTALVLVAVTPTSAPWLWAVMLGLGSGGVFTLALTVPLRVTSSVEATRRLTGRMLGYGYLMAASGPFVVSLLRSAAGGFGPAFLLLAALCAGAASIAAPVATDSR